jgi:cobyrinic acid a,c-diamide synthase
MDRAALKRWAVDFEPAPEGPPVAPRVAGKTVAVARAAAFWFIFAANLDTLRALGAQVVFFSPLANEPVPACDAVWLPGGYPELHADTLSAAHTSRDSLAAHVGAGRPVWAECGGMMVLFDAIVDQQSQSHAVWGLLPGVVRMQPRLAALGPQKLCLASGELRGHTFHYSRCETALEPVLHTASARGGAVGLGEALYQRGALRASYFHAWLASSPAAAAALFLPEALS